MVSAGLTSPALCFPTAEPLVDETVNGVAAEEGGELTIAGRKGASKGQAAPGGTLVRLITCVCAGMCCLSRLAVRAKLAMRPDGTH